MKCRAAGLSGVPFFKEGGREKVERNQPRATAGSNEYVITQMLR